MTANEILEKHCKEYGTFFHIGIHDAVIEGDIRAVFAAMKEISQSSFIAGVRWQIGNQCEQAFGPKNEYLDQEQFIKQLFGEEEI